MEKLISALKFQTDERGKIIEHLLGKYLKNLTKLEKSVSQLAKLVDEIQRKEDTQCLKK